MYKKGNITGVELKLTTLGKWLNGFGHEIPKIQNSTKIPVFSNCACLKPFQEKTGIGKSLTLKTGGFSLYTPSRNY